MKITTRNLTLYGTNRIEVTVDTSEGELSDAHNPAESEEFALDALSALAEHTGTQTLEATEDGKTSSGQYFVGVNGVQIPLSDAFVEQIRNEDPRIVRALEIIDEHNSDTTHDYDHRFTSHALEQVESTLKGNFDDN